MPSVLPDVETTVTSMDTTITTTATDIGDQACANGNGGMEVLYEKQQEQKEGKLETDVVTGTAGFDQSDAKVIREDVLQCLSRKQKVYRLVLTSSEILLQEQNQHGPNKNHQPSNLERYSIADLFGIHTLRHKQNGPSFVSAYVCFYIYPRRKRVLLSKSKLREKVPIVFEIRKAGNSYEDNLAIALKWKEDAIKLIQKKYPKWQAHLHHRPGSKQIEENGGAESIQENNNGVVRAVENSSPIGEADHIMQKLSFSSSNYSLSFLKRYLVIINPVSGQGKGVAVFNERVHPILLEAGVKVELLITEHAGHARAVVSSSSNLKNLDGILTVGGDGLLYEVVNGLMSRQDVEKVSKIPLGAIASGSGNGLARSIAQYSKEDADYLKNPILTTTLAAARGRVIPVNLMNVEMNGKKSSAFLSVGWGLLSDIDVESEVLRAIGEPRFTLWAFLRLAKLRSYKAQLTYVPCERVLTNGTSSSPSSSSYPTVKTRAREPVTVDTDFISVYSTCQSFIGTDMIFAPGAEPGDGLIHLTYFSRDAGRTAATQFLLGIERGSHLNVNGVTYVTVEEFTIRSPGGFNGTVTVDGESVKVEEIRVAISPQPLYVFAL